MLLQKNKITLICHLCQLKVYCTEYVKWNFLENKSKINYLFFFKIPYKIYSIRIRTSASYRFLFLFRFHSFKVRFIVKPFELLYILDKNMN